MAMGTFYGTNYDSVNSPTISTFLPAKIGKGNIHCAMDTFYASGTDLDIGSTAHLGIRIPKGAIVQYSVVYPVDSDSYDEPHAMTLGVTGSLGIAGDPDLFGNVAALNSATPQIVVPKPDGTTYTNAMDSKLEADADVIFTTATAALTATEGICVKMFYSVD